MPWWHCGPWPDKVKRPGHALVAGMLLLAWLLLGGSHDPGLLVAGLIILILSLVRPPRQSVVPTLVAGLGLVALAGSGATGLVGSFDGNTVSLLLIGGYLLWEALGHLRAAPGNASKGVSSADRGYVQRLGLQQRLDHWLHWCDTHRILSLFISAAFIGVLVAVLDVGGGPYGPVGNGLVTFVAVLVALSMINALEWLAKFMK